MNFPLDAWDVAEEKVREALVAVTGLIKDEDLAGLAFGIALVVTDHLFERARAFAR